MATRELIKPKMALPMHYGTNAALVGTPDEYLVRSAMRRSRCSR